MTIMSTKRRIWNIIFSDSKLVITRPQVNLRVDTRPLQLVKQIIDPQKWITVLHTPQGEELGLMNPLSASSYNWVDNSCISDGASLYGDHATDAASGTKSI
ncbi:hypothetical protein Tco_0679061 [Tanacetum coccineum]|uniref:Uncharacterized protein n=1 Tax=Tanacetum coccineum TaxID=301880 RepID=A0ABQ4XIA2_9ASTR